MKSKQEIIEQWEQIKTKHNYFLEQKRENNLPPKGKNKRYVDISKTMVVNEIDSEFVYTVYGSHQDGMFIQAVMDDLSHDIEHFEKSFTNLEEQVNGYLKSKTEE